MILSVTIGEKFFGIFVKFSTKICHFFKKCFNAMVLLSGWLLLTANCGWRAQAHPNPEGYRQWLHCFNEAPHIVSRTFATIFIPYLYYDISIDISFSIFFQSAWCCFILFSVCSLAFFAPSICCKLEKGSIIRIIE